MNAGRTIGLIGGLGVGAAVHYYTHLAKALEKKGAHLDLVMAHAEALEVSRLVGAADRAGLAGYLAGFLHRLAAAGAEIAVIPAVTPHFCIDELRLISPLPIVNIFDPLAEYLASQAMKKVAVFGTRYVIQSDLFGMLPGVEFVHLTAEEVEAVHDIYFELVLSNHGSPEAHDRLNALAQTLCQRDGAEAILLAGTDLALVFNESNTTFPAVDVAALHLDAIVKAALA